MKLKTLLTTPVLALSLVALLTGCSPTDFDQPAGGSSASKPPAGFTALFNGKDLTGWRGGTTFDHRKLLEMSEADRAEQIRKWTDPTVKGSMM